MVKTPSWRPSARRRDARADDGLPPDAAPAAGVRFLHQEIDDDRALVDRTQRAVARGRRTVVDIHDCVVQFRHVRSLHAAGGARAATAARERLAELLQRVDAAHQRLLMLSANVEMEIDRLEVTRSEIDRLTKPPEGP